MKSSRDLVEKELIPFFGAKTIGSFNLISDGLKYEAINDIDILLKPSINAGIQQHPEIRSYLKSKGFSEKKSPTHNGSSYQNFDGNYYFESKEYDKPIHILVNKDDNVNSNSWIVKSKYERGRKTDFQQLLILLNHKNDTIRGNKKTNQLYENKKSK